MSSETTERTTAVEWRRVFFGKRPKLAMYRALFLALVCFVSFKFFVMLVKVDGRSMAPAYRDGSIHLVNRLAYKKEKPKRGDVVAIRTTGESILFLKRIIGLPGERVLISAGIVYIDGEPLDEPYVKAREGWEWGPKTLEGDEYLVIGDNRGMDQMLHSFGRIREHRILGKAVW